MALIICPDCGHKISQYAETCNQCGFPLQNKLSELQITDFTKTLICPKCGSFRYISKYNTDNSIPILCEYCHTFYVQTNLEPDEIEDYIWEEFHKGNEDFEADIAK